MDTKNEILDSIMGCPTCGYYTCKPRDFARHQTTKKHLMKIDVDMKKKENELNDEPTPEPEPELESIQPIKKPKRRRNKKIKNEVIINTPNYDELYDLNNNKNIEYLSNLNDYNNDESLTLFKILLFLFNYLMDILFEKEPPAIQ